MRRNLRPLTPLFNPEKRRGVLISGNTPVGDLTYLCDDFNRADQDQLGANWSTPSLGGYDIVSNTARTGSANAQFAFDWVTAAGQDDVYGEGISTYAGTGGNSMGIQLRHNSTVSTGYCGSWVVGGGSIPSPGVYRIRISPSSANSGTIVAESAPIAKPASGAHWRFECRGGTQKLFINGTLVLTGYDSTQSGSSRRRAGFSAAVGSGLVATNWQAWDDVCIGPLTPAPYDAKSFPAKITTTVTTPAVTKSAGSTTSPAVIARSVALPSPTAQAGAMATPAEITTPVTLPAPTVTP